MIIRVDKIENMLQDTAEFFDKSPDKLLSEICTFDFYSFDKYGQDIIEYIEKSKRKYLDEIYMCHITRKLNGIEIKSLLNIPKLLLSENSFTKFTKEYGIEFQRGTEQILIYHKGELVTWDKDRFLKNGFNPYRLTSRLDLQRGDQGVNGFCFLYNVKESMNYDYSIYRKGPELLQDLDLLLGLTMRRDFSANSKVYCALCRIPVDQVRLCNTVDRTSTETDYLCSVLTYLWEFMNPEFQTEDMEGTNRIIRTPNEYTVSVEKWIPEEDIPCHN